ncbi:MAG: hypothetical protein IPI57_16370 [Candidatus Competibacteraceae bacterium]|nr:hypothetical protein [Candidatus Competibacteraceae bacterium]
MTIQIAYAPTTKEPRPHGQWPDGGSISRGADLFVDRLGRRDSKFDIADLKRALADHVGPNEEALINRAATRAVELVFANIGVDVNDPKDLQRFRDDLRFGAMIRRYRELRKALQTRGSRSASVATSAYPGCNRSAIQEKSEPRYF